MTTPAEANPDLGPGVCRPGLVARPQRTRRHPPHPPTNAGEGRENRRLPFLERASSTRVVGGADRGAEIGRRVGGSANRHTGQVGGQLHRRMRRLPRRPDASGPILPKAFEDWRRAGPPGFVGFGVFPLRGITAWRCLQADGPPIERESKAGTQNRPRFVTAIPAARRVNRVPVGRRRRRTARATFWAARRNHLELTPSPTKSRRISPAETSEALIPAWAAAMGPGEAVSIVGPSSPCSRAIFAVSVRKAADSAGGGGTEGERAEGLHR